MFESTKYSKHAQKVFKKLKKKKVTIISATERSQGMDYSYGEPEAEYWTLTVQWEKKNGTKWEQRFSDEYWYDNAPIVYSSMRRPRRITDDQ